MQITTDINPRLLCDDAARDRIIRELAETYVASLGFDRNDDFYRSHCERGIRIGMALILGGTEAAESVARQK